MRPRPDLKHTLRLMTGLLTALWLALVPLGVHAADEFLDPEVAFKLTAQLADARGVEVVVTAAPGYYLYREAFKFVARGAVLGAPVFPPGHTKFDETYQKNVETYRGEVHFVVPVERAPARFRLLVTSQGCADKGLCYPPAERAIDVALVGFGGDGSVRTSTAAQTATTDTAPGETLAQVSPPAVAPSGGGLDATLRAGHFWRVVGVFLVAGVLLSLTPCVLPMLPIVSSIIVGQGAAASRGRGFRLALAYSLGMALVYTALGVAAGLAGEGLAAALQNAWVLGAFAALLVVLSMSMFGVYELQLPAGITGRLTQASQRLPAGRLASVFAMGGVSALIVSPCVAAPLAGALVYLSQTRDVWLGGMALFSLAAGMSVPLLLIGASAGALLPRAGAWMDGVKRFFGLLLLGVAIWTVQPVLPAALSLALWGALAVSTAVLLMPGAASAMPESRKPAPWRRCLAAVLAICGLLELAGAASGGTDPLQPLARWALRTASNPAAASDSLGGGPAFQPVRSVAELDAVLRSAKRPVVLDFYADWCVSCKEMERLTFTHEDVRKRLAAAVLLRADVTANTPDDRALLKRFGLFGPPGTLFFDDHGLELAPSRVIGFENADQFGQSLARAGL